MTRVLKRRPSPVMVIALIALFLSLGGVSYGVATGSIDSREIKNDTVRSKDLRNNDIRTRDIRDSAVRGKDIALNTITGDDVDESSLGKVPSSGQADSAKRAESAGSVSVLKTIPPTSLVPGDEALVLAQHGPLTLTAVCFGSGGVPRLEVRVASAQANSTASGIAGTFAELGPSSGQVTVAGVEVTGGESTMIQSPVTASARSSGRALSGVLSLHADVGLACTVHGHLVLDG
jgi:hypothetical protein